jgi:transposase
MSRKPYSTDLTDAQWETLQECLPKTHKCLPKAHNGRTGCPRKHEPREVANALLYLLHNGCTWRDLPHDLPPWENVYDQFRRWREDASIECLHDLLREKVRVLEGRQPTPSAAIVDSQSVKTAEKGAVAADTMAASRSKGASDILP